MPEIFAGAWWQTYFYAIHIKYVFWPQVNTGADFLEKPCRPGIYKK